MHYSKLSVLSVIAAALSRVVGGPVTPPWGEMLVKHEWTNIPVNWVTLGHPPDGASIDLHIALKPYREKALTDALLEVSQPGSPKYRAHLTKKQVAQLVAPHPDTFELVRSWLKHNGVPPPSILTTHGGCWLTVPGVPVSQANRLLGASYQLYHHPGTNETILRTKGYALPSALHLHVKTIAPTTAFTSTGLLQHKSPRKRSSGAVNATSGEPVGMLSRQEPDELDIKPSILHWQYKMTTYNPKAIGRNALGIVGYRNEVPMLPDVTMFLNAYRKDQRFSLPNLRQIDERYGSSFGVQSTLDVEYALGLAAPTPVIYYVSTGSGTQIDLRTGESGPGDEYLMSLRFLIDQPDTPKTISLGYGTPELSVPWEYADAQCLLFAQLGMRGISVLVASGDYGVGPETCVNSNGAVQFQTNFPASCPWVTSVGGTMLTGDPSEIKAMEEVANVISGGGFSAYFPRHKYQDTVVESYIGQHASEFYGYFVPEGRGVPDIALQSSRYIIISSDPSLNTVDPHHLATSTSCATITAAAVISWLNDFLAVEGEPPLGFLNPWLYGAGWLGFKDIATGRNPGCGTRGFTAEIGWDPVTGFGSPNFRQLLRLAKYRYPFHPPRNESFP